MKVNIKQILPLLFIVIIAACNNEQKQQANEKLTSLTKTEESAKEGCLFQYANKYDEILTVDQAAEILNFDKENSKTEYSKIMDTPAFQKLSYTWQGDRKRKIDTGFGTIESPKPDYVEVGGMKLMTTASFNKDFGVKSETEIQETLKLLDKSFNEALDQKSKSKEANEAGKKINESGVSKADATKVQKSISEGKIAKTLRAYQGVEGVGDLASWNTFEQRLNVLKEGVRFYVEVDVSEDINLNKVKAIEIAKLILTKCNQN